MCFSLQWWESLLIWIVIIAAVIAVLQILVPYVLSKLAAGGIIGEVVNVGGQIVRVIIWAIIIIALIIFVFALLSCLISMGGGIWSIFPHAR